MNDQAEEELKPISEAQAKHLSELLAIRNQAEADLQRFMAYLYAEHKIDPADGWTTIDPQRGFVRTVSEETSGAQETPCPRSISSGLPCVYS